MGACFNQLLENESKESLAQMVCDGLDKIVALEAALREKDDSLAQARGCANDRFHEIEKLEAQLAQLKEAWRTEVERLSAPVSDAEWEYALVCYTTEGGIRYTRKAYVDALLAARREGK